MSYRGTTIRDTAGTIKNMFTKKKKSLKPVKSIRRGTIADLPRVLKERQKLLSEY